MCKNVSQAKAALQVLLHISKTAPTYSCEILSRLEVSLVRQDLFNEFLDEEWPTCSTVATVVQAACVCDMQQIREQTSKTAPGRAETESKATNWTRGKKKQSR